jgi:hypothetical protein
MLKGKVERLRWATITELGHEDLTVHFSGEQGSWKVWRLKLRDRHVTLPIGDRHRRHDDIEFNSLANDLHSQGP